MTKLEQWVKELVMLTSSMHKGKMLLLVQKHNIPTDTHIDVLVKRIREEEFALFTTNVANIARVESLNLWTSWDISKVNIESSTGKLDQRSLKHYGELVDLVCKYDSRGKYDLHRLFGLVNKPDMVELNELHEYLVQSTNKILQGWVLDGLGATGIADRITASIRQFYRDGNSGGKIPGEFLNLVDTNPNGYY